MSVAAVIEARSVSKDFGPVRVLDQVDLAIQAGEVHAVIGENGAGKSTLMRILSGVYQPSEGEVALDGSPVVYGGPSDAERRGVIMIHQEFNLAETLTVEQNVFLGREMRRGPFLDRRRMRKETKALLATLNVDIDPDAPVYSLSVSQKQMVEIAKALYGEARALIMDEPTATLSNREIETLFDLIRRLAEKGVAIIYISHRLGEVSRIADRVSVLKDGRLVRTAPASELSVDDMARLMVGRELSEIFPEKRVVTSSDLVLEVRNVSVPPFAHDCSFVLKRGEILGFAGLVGAGRTELMEGLFGLRRRLGGEIIRNGRPVRIRNMADAVQQGMVYLTEDRKGKGLLLEKGMGPNLTLLSLGFRPGPWINRRHEAESLEEAIEQFDIRAADPSVRVGLLSGGNQQKLSLAKMMQVEPEIVVFDEPTRGIDVGTKQQVYRFIHDLAAQGKSCIVISSELQEIIGLCHRTIVMREGRIAGELAGEAIVDEAIMRIATGVAHAV